MKRYSKIGRGLDDNGNVYYNHVNYPIPPRSFQDIYVFTTVGDRFDILANQYYGDPSLWWAISSANPNLEQNSYYIPEGTQIRIPANVGDIISNFELQNV
tara:strand:- start:626 stop:925 length:300 start_codon:yes stop_codon:yes gene_type:complete